MEQEIAQGAQTIITLFKWMGFFSLFVAIGVIISIGFIRQEEGKARLIQNIGGGLAKIIFPSHTSLQEGFDGTISSGNPTKSYFGFQWKGIFYKDYFIPAQKTEIRNGNKANIQNSLKENEEILQSFTSKDADGKANKEEHIILRKEKVNYIRPVISILIPLDDIETGVPEGMKDNFENISVECLIQIVFEITNLRKTINKGGGDFYEILKLGVKSSVEPIVAEMDYQHFMQSADESGGTNARISSAILLLNTDRRAENGSDSYEDIYGIKIIKVTVTNRGMGSRSKKIADQLEKTRIATEEAKQTEIKAEAAKKATIAKAKGDAEAKKEMNIADADGITKIGEAQNEVRKNRVVDPDIEAIAKGIAETHGTFAGDGLTNILNIGKEKKQEEKETINIKQKKEDNNDK